MNPIEDADRIMARMEAALKRARDPYSPPEVRLGALVTISADATLAALRMAGYQGELVYLGPARSPASSLRRMTTFFMPAASASRCKRHQAAPG